jgi:hypothetical protein
MSETYNDANPVKGRKVFKGPEKIHVWPYLVRNEFLCFIAAMLFMTLWSVFIDAPLEEAANPSVTPNPSKAPWYFLGLQELLVYFDPWIAGVVLPTLIIVGLMAIPYIDINEKGNGYYTFRERKFAVSMFFIGFVVLWVSMIVLGTFMRGPGWLYFHPWEEWTTKKIVAQTNIDLLQIVSGGAIPPAILAPWINAILGLLIVGVYYALMPLGWMLFKTRETFQKLGVARYYVTAFLTLTMMGVVIKMFLRLAFNVKYVCVVKLTHVIPGLEFNI